MTKLPFPPSPFMAAALAEAQNAAMRGEVPIGAVITLNNSIIARAGNETRAQNDPTAHAEILAIRRACAERKDFRLTGCDLYVTLEPCAMCAGAIAEARIRRIYFGAYDPKSGGVCQGACVFSHPQCHHQPEIIGGIAEKAAGELLSTFFAKNR